MRTHYNLESCQNQTKLNQIGRKSKNSTIILGNFKTKQGRFPRLKNISVNIIRGIKRSYRDSLKSKTSKNSFTKIDINNERQYSRYLDIFVLCLNNQEFCNKISQTINGPEYEGKEKRKKMEIDVSLESKNEKSINNSFCREFYSNRVNQTAYYAIIDIIFAEMNCISLCNRFKFQCCNLELHSEDCIKKWKSLQTFFESQYLTELKVEIFDERVNVMSFNLNQEGKDPFEIKSKFSNPDWEDSSMRTVDSLYLVNEIDLTEILKEFKLKIPDCKAFTQKQLKLNQINQKLVTRIRETFKIFTEAELPSTENSLFDLRNPSHRKEWETIVKIFRDQKNEIIFQYLKEKNVKNDEKFLKKLYTQEATRLIMKSLLEVIFSESNIQKLCSELEIFCCSSDDHSSTCIEKWTSLKLSLNTKYINEITPYPPYNLKFIEEGNQISPDLNNSSIIPDINISRRQKNRFTKILEAFETKNLKKKFRTIFFNVFIIRAIKRILRCVVSNRIPTKTCIKVNENIPAEVSCWSELKNIFNENPEIIKKISKTIFGPDGKMNRKKEENFLYISENTYKSHDNAFCRHFFSHPSVQCAFKVVVKLFFSDFQPEKLAERFRITCCSENCHGIECNVKWNTLKEYLDCEYLVDLGVIIDN